MGASYLPDVFITKRLKDKFAAISSCPITTVVAPMGYGKTTAVKWWSMRRTKSNQSALFFRQIIMTNSVTDFWTGFCKLFKSFPDAYEQLSALPIPKNIRTLSLYSEVLTNVLSEQKKDVYFILDDLHILSSKLISQIVMSFIKQLPNNIHIVLLSRNEIFTEKEKMALGHLLAEITTDDLRLNKQELYEYAQLCGIQASTEEIDQLASLSEGWFSIVYLNFKAYEKNGQWLSRSNDIFSLINEVLLEPLRQEERAFLILIGITNEFTKEQAAYLWAGSGIGGDSDLILDDLSRKNAFITKTDNLYRYHHMLQQCARHHFAQQSPDYQKMSYTRLGDWFMAQEDYLQAYLTYAKAENYEKILSCIEKDRCVSLNAEHQQEFFTWIDNCPEATLIQYPNALTICMVTMFTFNNIAGLYRLKGLLLKSLAINETLSEEEKNNLLGDAEISESFTAFNNITAMSAYHKRACALLERVTYSVDRNSPWTFGSPSVLMLYHSTVGSADVEQKDMKECMPYYYQVADCHGNGAEHVFAAELHYERGEFIDADILNKMAMAAAKRKQQFSILLASAFLSMRLEVVQGNYIQVQTILNDMRNFLIKKKQYALLHTWDICQLYIATVLNRPENVPEWLAEGKLTEALVKFPAMPMLHTFYN